MTQRIRTILVVEDDEDDFFFTQRVLSRLVKAQVVHVQSGRAAIDYLAGEGAFADRATHPFPELVFVDLKMEQGTGHDVLASVRNRSAAARPRIFVLTGSNEPRDRELVKSSGVADGYIVKPLTADHVLRILG
jgi:CheY-like chemotaxis protein